MTLDRSGIASGRLYIVLVSFGVASDSFETALGVSRIDLNSFGVVLNCFQVPREVENNSG